DPLRGRLPARARREGRRGRVLGTVPKTRLNWRQRDDGAAAVHFVDDVNGLVLAVGAGDPEQHREPADRPEPSLLRQNAVEDELAPDPVEVPARLLRDPVHVHLVTLSDAGWSLNTRPPPLAGCHCPCGG